MNAPSAMSLAAFETRLPFLYPCLFRQTPRHASRARRISSGYYNVRTSSVQVSRSPEEPSDTHLNPAPSSYSQTPFTDKCTMVLSSGSGGHGCVSFLREKYIAEGPPNGGDGGDGGSVFIQAVRGETSLHKLARKGVANAGRGRNGRGKGQGGESGADVCITVPVGTVVKELRRSTPDGGMISGGAADGEFPVDRLRQKRRSTDSAWIMHPGMSKTEAALKTPPPLPRKRQSIAQAAQPPHPIKLDLDSPMDRPTLIAAGAVGGLGNVHFVSRVDARPQFATRGESGISVTLELELKMLADVGLVGLPNAGKSTLLRALSNSRTRVGNWAFTTLQPTIGTVVLDDHTGRPSHRAYLKSGDPRTTFSVADIPGLIEDAHKDRGLGLGFLRHVERAGILAFVIDLSAGDAVLALQALWREVGEYEGMRGMQVNAETESRMHDERLEGTAAWPLPAPSPPISSKPWFVVATKADLPGTQDNYQNLQKYVDSIGSGLVAHPSGRPNAWRKSPITMPVSAINAEGVERIPGTVLELLA